MFGPWAAIPKPDVVGLTMLKIEARSENSGAVVLHLSGRIQSDDLKELNALLAEEPGRIVLDLKEITLVDRDSLRFLATRAASGIELRNCPTYVREWMRREMNGRMKSKWFGS